jgi:RND family efflux transporter MFP subunit
VSVQTQAKQDSLKKLFMVFLPRGAAVVVVLAIGLGAFRLMTLSNRESDKRPPASASVMVRTIESRHLPTDRVWSGYGTARTMQSAEIVAEVSGRVLERPAGIEPGQSVRKGELIVRLDDTDYINALDSARQALRSIEAQIDGLDVEEEQTRLQVQYAGAEIEAAKRDLARVDEAIAANAGTAGERDALLTKLLGTQRLLASLQQQLDLIPSRRMRLQAELSSQRASERIAQLNVDRASITAPFDSEIQTVMPREGDWVAMGTSVARLVDLSQLEVPLKLPASASSWVRVGDTVNMWVRSPGGEPERVGEIVRVAPEADVASRTITVYAEVRQDPSDPDRLLPGQFVHGRVVTHDEHDRVILPRRAVQSESVFVVGELANGSRLVESVPVRVAYSFEGRRPALDPIETQWVALELGYEPVEGSPVVVSLFDQLVEGMKVRLESDPTPEPIATDVAGERKGDDS